jgi:hypothetical protein
MINSQASSLWLEWSLTLREMVAPPDLEKIRITHHHPPLPFPFLLPTATPETDASIATLADATFAVCKTGADAVRVAEAPSDPDDARAKARSFGFEIELRRGVV